MIQYLVFVGAFISLVFVIPYIRDTIKGKTKPNRVSWLLWSVATLIGFFVAISDGVGLSAIPIFISGFFPLLVFVFSFVNKKSYWKLESFDYICGLSSILALLLWLVIKDPMLAILFAIIGDFFATIPTLKKSFKFPETETLSAYVGGLINVITSFFAMKFWNFSELAFPIYLIFIDTLLVVLVSKKFYNKK